MNEKYKKILTYVAIAIVVLSILSICFVSIRYNRKFRNLEKSLTESRDTVIELGERVRQQESVIESITTRQSELETLTGELESELRETRDIAERTTDTVNELIGVEQDIDGYTGAIRGTVKQVSDTIDLTLQGISSEGITD